MSRLVNLIHCASIGIIIISVTSLFVSECSGSDSHVFLIASLDRYPFVVSK